MSPSWRWIISTKAVADGPSDWTATRDLALAALEDLKAVDPVVLDVRDKTSITDAMIVVSGNSGRHVKAIADNLVEEAKARGVRPLGVEGADSAEWILVDLGDVVVHVMMERVRELYRLERIWGIDEDTDAESAPARGAGQ